MEGKAGNEWSLRGYRPAKRTRATATRRVFCGSTWTSPSDSSSATYLRATARIPSAEPEQSASSVNRPHECQRLRLTRRAPHFGQCHSGCSATGATLSRASAPQLATRWSGRAFGRRPCNHERRLKPHDGSCRQSNSVQRDFVKSLRSCGKQFAPASYRWRGRSDKSDQTESTQNTELCSRAINGSPRNRSACNHGLTVGACRDQCRFRDA